MRVSLLIRVHAKRSAKATELRGADMGEVHRLIPSETVFGLQAAGRLMNKIFASWVQDLALLVDDAGLSIAERILPRSVRAEPVHRNENKVIIPVLVLPNRKL